MNQFGKISDRLLVLYTTDQLVSVRNSVASDPAKRVIFTNA